MKIELYHRILIHDKNGKLVKRTHWKKSKSFVLQFLQNLEVITAHAWAVSGPTLTVKDTGGVSRSVVCFSGNFPATYYLAIFAGDDTSTYGIEVGTGTGTPTNADYALGTQIAHGVGSGQLDYGAHSKTDAQVVGSNVDFVINRTFYNGSGGSITVTEIGIVCTTVDSSQVQRYFLIARDLVTAITVDNLKTLTVQYTIRTTV